MKTKTKKKTPARRAVLPTVRLHVHPNVIIAYDDGRELFAQVINTGAPTRFTKDELAAHHVAAFKGTGRKVSVTEFDGNGNPIK